MGIKDILYVNHGYKSTHLSMVVTASSFYAKTNLPFGLGIERPNYQNQRGGLVRQIFSVGLRIRSSIPLFFGSFVKKLKSI